jgi:hypothetical protein
MNPAGAAWMIWDIGDTFRLRSYASTSADVTSPKPTGGQTFYTRQSFQKAAGCTGTAGWRGGIR